VKSKEIDDLIYREESGGFLMDDDTVKNATVCRREKRTSHPSLPARESFT
jgi:hypothetical protein